MVEAGNTCPAAVADTLAAAVAESSRLADSGNMVVVVAGLQATGRRDCSAAAVAVHEPAVLEVALVLCEGCGYAGRRKGAGRRRLPSRLDLLLDSLVVRC